MTAVWGQLWLPALSVGWCYDEVNRSTTYQPVSQSPVGLPALTNMANRRKHTHRKRELELQPSCSYMKLWGEFYFCAFLFGSRKSIGGMYSDQKKKKTASKSIFDKTEESLETANPANQPVMRTPIGKAQISKHPNWLVQELHFLDGNCSKTKLERKLETRKHPTWTRFPVLATCLFVHLGLASICLVLRLLLTEMFPNSKIINFPQHRSPLSP